MSNAAVALQQITKNFGTVRAVDGVSVSIGAGEFFSLLGPSGCGKTTLLRLIAGFEGPDAGEIYIQGKSVSKAPSQDRPVNTVFQNYALFPHLSVFDNVAFGLRMRKTPRPEIARRVDEVMELTHISDLRARFPGQISGGQKQRVAVARALVNRPSVLLLDEPLAAIDAKLRAQLQSDLRALQRHSGTTFIYVTHDQDEALALSDRIALMQQGRISQVGTPSEVYERPRDRFAASFLGGCNVFSGTLRSPQQLETPFGLLNVAAKSLPQRVSFWGIRRENIRFASVHGPNSVQGTITEICYTGAQTEYIVRVQEHTIRINQPNNGASSLPRRGDSVLLHLPAESILLLEES